MVLRESEITALKEISNYVNNEATTSQIINLCNQLRSQLEDKNFAFTYAGVLLATKDRIESAIKLFELCPENAFDSVLREYLLETKSFTPAAIAFQDTLPYDVWTQTDFYKSYMMATLETVKDFAKINPPPETSKIPTIVDVGPGNGVLITEIINQLVSIYNIKNLQLVLIDKSLSMLEASEKYVQEHVPIPISFTKISCKLQEITEEQLAVIREKPPIWFINMAASVHHMPWEDKLPMLKTVRSLSNNCLLIEFPANHDRPEKNTPELVYSVSEHYRFYIQDVLNCPAPETDKKICLYNFILTEGITILSQERANRIDYHATIPEWQELAEQAGFQVVKISPTTFLNERPLTFTMQLKFALSSIE